MNNSEKTEIISKSGTDIEFAIKKYIEENIAKVTMTDLAKHFNFSVIYFGKFFKKTFNETFRTYIIKVRMQKAFELIVETNLPIKDIIEKVGYADKKNFYKQFKRFANTTPKLLRTKVE